MQIGVSLNKKCDLVSEEMAICGHRYRWIMNNEEFILRQVEYELSGIRGKPKFKY